MSQNVLISQQDMNRTIARLSYSVVEKLPLQNLVLLGIHTGGAVLAKRIAGFLKQNKGIEIPVGVLDITSFRDDLHTKPHSYFWLYHAKGGNGPFSPWRVGASEMGRPSDAFSMSGYRIPPTFYRHARSYSRLCAYYGGRGKPLPYPAPNPWSV